MAEVITFRDTFDVADRGDITGYNGWVARTTETPEVVSQSVTAPSGANPAYARQETSTVSGDVVECEFRVVVTDSNATKGITVAIGSYGADNASATIGFAVRVVETNGTWNMARIADPRALLGAAAWVVDGTMLPATDGVTHIGVVQAVRVRWSVALGGTRMQVWWNGDAETHPVIDHTYPAQFVAVGSAARGFILIGSDNGASTGEMRLLGIVVSVATQADKLDPAAHNYATVQEILDRALSRFQGNRQAASFGSERMMSLIQEAQDSVLTEMGNSAWFLRRIESFSMSPDGSRRVTMPLHMSVIHSITADNGSPVSWRLVGFNYDDRQVIETSYCGTVSVTFTAKRDRITPDGRVSVHRDVDRCLVDKVAELMANSHGSAEEREDRRRQAAASMASALTHCQQRMHPVRVFISPVGVRQRRRLLNG